MKTAKIIVLTFFSIFLVACGGKEEKKKEGFSYEKKSEVSEKVADNPNDVIITSNDVMQFNKNEIRVKAGKPVKITLKHIGKMDKQVMGHNFVLLKQGVDITKFSAKASTERDNKYIPTDTDDIIAHTDLIGGGEVTSIEFDAPEAGIYDFICSFPGHSGLMRGKFIVE